MPIIPNFLERLVMLRLNQAPAPTLDMYGAIANRAVSVALRLEVFETLRDGPLPAGEVARKIEVNPRGITVLLEALAAVGYLERSDEDYANTAMTQKWMLLDSPTTIAHLFLFFDTVIERSAALEETIRAGKPPILGWEWFNQHPGSWEAYYAGMLDGARLSADEVVSRVTLPPGAQTLLDVGGGHGLYSVRFCQRYAGLSATVLDWPQALAAAERTVAAEGIGDRVRLQAGDLWRDDLGSGYDIALLFNIVHMYPPEKNRALIERVSGALKTGGVLVIMDQVASKGRGSAAKAIARLQGLQLFNTVLGQTYPSEEVAGWLKSANYSVVRTQMLRRSPSSGLVTGVKGRI